MVRFRPIFASLLCFVLAFSNAATGVATFWDVARSEVGRVLGNGLGYTELGKTRTARKDICDKPPNVQTKKVRPGTRTLKRGECDELSMPDGTWEAWGYNALGDVSEYDCNGFYPGISYDYDDCSRLTLINYPSGTDTSFTYDHDGRTTSMVDSSGTTSWEYDDADRLIELTTPQGVMEYTYNLASQRETMVEIGSPNRTTTYAYDDAGRLETLTNPESEDTAFEYDEGSRLTKMTRENGTYTSYGYDSRSRVNSLIHKKANHDVISSEAYTWDAASNLSSKTVDSVQTDYTYDAIDQLLSEVRSGYSASYTYDANGNRLTKTLNSVTDTYICDEGDKLTSITRGGNTIRSFTYEKFGRMATSVENSVTTTYAYDYEARLTSVTRSGMTTNTFTYNGLDTRVGKVDSGGTKTFKRDGAYVTDPVLTDGAATYTPGISERRSSTTKYSLSNWLGSTSHLIAANESTTDTRQYDAFGNITSSSGSTPHPFTFAGQWGYQTDSDTGLQLLGHRYYDPTIGRFLTRDPIKDGRNWFIYCGNNPLAYVDDQGHGPLSIIRRVIIHGGRKRIWGDAISEGTAREIRNQGGNVGVEGTNKNAKRIAKEIEDSVEGKTIHHDANQDIYGEGHFQTKGHKGHTYYRTPIVLPFSDLGDRVGDVAGDGAGLLIDLINPLGDVELVVNGLFELFVGGDLGNWWETWPDKNLLPMPGQLAEGNGSPRYH